MPDDVEFLHPSEADGPDEDLPNTEPHWLRARVPLAIAAALLVLTAVIVRAAQSDPGQPQAQPSASPALSTSSPPAASAPPATSAPPSTSAPPPSSVDGLTVHVGGSAHVIRIPVALTCSERQALCAFAIPAPPAARAAVRHYFPHARIVSSGVASATHASPMVRNFDSLVVSARDGHETITVSVHRARSDDPPPSAAQRDTASGTEIHVDAQVRGYRVVVDVHRPTGPRGATLRDMRRLARDARLRAAS